MAFNSLRDALVTIVPPRGGNRQDVPADGHPNAPVASMPPVVFAAPSFRLRRASRRPTTRYPSDSVCSSGERASSKDEFAFLSLSRVDGGRQTTKDGISLKIQPLPAPFFARFVRALIRTLGSTATPSSDLSTALRRPRRLWRSSACPRPRAWPK